MKRKSEKPGAVISGPEVTEVTPTGFRLLLSGRERVLSFHDFPWFEKASARQIRNVEQVSADHLRWPELDIDLSVESIDDPEHFPLVWRAVP